ncbi:hypothetical protein RRG08_033219 [Elysia crispata]|uniref:Uncharacterized protein n=1 Tax=Elysia crispata TaxID=231223 RepID=A0AAE1EDD3_9GAST|nr:hypothetical protein RRG08_033219 [Elysia crispata]
MINGLRGTTKGAAGRDGARRPDIDKAESFDVQPVAACLSCLQGTSGKVRPGVLNEAIRLTTRRYGSLH